MNRKSMHIFTDTISSVIPNNRNQKTNQSLQINDFSRFSIHERYSAQTMSDQAGNCILLNADQVTKISSKQEFLQAVIQNIYDLKLVIQTSISPVCQSCKSEETFVNFKLESQPLRIQYDPMCGFDRLIVRKSGPKGKQDRRKDNSKFSKHKRESYCKNLSNSYQITSVLPNERNLVPLSRYFNKSRDSLPQTPQINHPYRLIQSSKSKLGSKLKTIYASNSDSQSKRCEVQTILSHKNLFRFSQKENLIYDYRGEIIEKNSKTHHFQNMTLRQNNRIIRTICGPLERTLVSSLHQESQPSLFLNSSKTKSRQKNQAKSEVNSVIIVPQKQIRNEFKFRYNSIQMQKKNLDIPPISQQIQDETCEQSQFQMTKAILNSSKNQYDQLHFTIQSKLPNLKQSFKLLQQNNVSQQQQSTIKRKVSRIKRVGFHKYKHHQTQKAL